MKLPDIQHLITFKEIYESSSFALAAQRLNITQPALSMQLKKFQEQFPLPLFKLMGKKKVPTTFGDFVYQESCKVLTHYQELFQNIERKHHPEEKLILKIGCRRELINTVIDQINFKGRVDFITLTSNQVLENLRQNKIDIGISRIKPSSSEIVSKKFLTNATWLVVHKNLLKNFNSKNIETNKSFLTQTPFLNYSFQFDLAKKYMEKLEISIQQIKVKYTVEDWLVILKLVEDGHGYSIIPDTMKSSSEEVMHIPLDQDESISHYWLYQKSIVQFPFYKNFFRKK